MADIDKALEIFGLDKLMFNQMKKSDLKVFIELTTKQESSLGLKQTYGKVLLDAKSKKVTIQEPDRNKGISNKLLKEPDRNKGISLLKEPQKIQRTSSINFDYYVPTSASIDILFTSLVSSNTSNTFI
jgi:hypothetical protein